MHACRSTLEDPTERGGYITRARNGQDRRSVDITVTERGKTALDSAPPLLQQEFRDRLRGLPEWERTMILATLQRVANLMDVADLEAAPHLVTGPEPI